MLSETQMEKCNRDRMTESVLDRASQLFLTRNNDQIISNVLIYYCVFFSGLVMSLDSPANKDINMPLTLEINLADIYQFTNVTTVVRQTLFLIIYFFLLNQCRSNGY